MYGFPQEGIPRQAANLHKETLPRKKNRTLLKARREPVHECTVLYSTKTSLMHTTEGKESPLCGSDLATTMLLCSV